MNISRNHILRNYKTNKKNYCELKMNNEFLSGGDNLSISMHKFLDNPSNESFKLFDIKYTKKEKKCLDLFNVDDFYNYDHYGSSELLGLQDFLGKNTKKCIDTVYILIQRITNDVLKAYKKDYCWLTVRISLPNNSYDIPRWHTDGNFYDSIKKNEKQSKFIITLKGPGTLLINPDDDTRDKFSSLNTHKILTKDEIRMKGYDLLKNENIIKANNQGIIFFVGNVELAAIHSEPPINEKRIFLSILPGHESEINELKKRWNVQ